MATVGRTKRTASLLLPLLILKVRKTAIQALQGFELVGSVLTINCLGIGLAVWGLQVVVRVREFYRNPNEATKIRSDVPQSYSATSAYDFDASHSHA